MKSAGNRGILKGSLQVLHVHVLLVAPLGAGHMAQSGADQHEGGVAVRETAHYTSAAADLPVEPLNDVIGTDASPVFTGKIAVYPKISQFWRDNWANLSTYFKYPQEVRRLIYTTNAIEGFNRQLRKVTKAKSVFPTDDSLLKMLYLAMMDITKKWTGRRQDWSVIHAQMAVYFAERMPE